MESVYAVLMVSRVLENFKGPPVVKNAYGTWKNKRGVEGWSDVDDVVSSKTQITGQSEVPDHCLPLIV